MSKKVGIGQTGQNQVNIEPNDTRNAKIAREKTLKSWDYFDKRERHHGVLKKGQM